MSKNLIIIRGISGSGKTTLASELSYSYEMQRINVVHLETDMYFYDENGDYNFDVSKLGYYHKKCLSDARDGLELDKVVIVSNTFTTLKELKPYFELAKEFDIVPIVYHCQNKFQNVHNVPENVLEKQKNRFQYDISSLYEN